MAKSTKLKEISEEPRVYIPTVGRRKMARARIRLTPEGSGLVKINDREIDEYLPVETLRIAALKPFVIAGVAKLYDVTIKVVGGGISGQADAIAHGIARALIVHNPLLRPPLKASGLLTRNAKEKERKKPGLKKARKAPQWSKR